MTRRIVKFSASVLAVLIAFTLVFFTLSTLTGCGKEPVTLTEINKTENTINVNGSFTLKVEPSRELEEGEVITWTSDATAVATVDANGKVTGVSSGTANITASIGESSLSCKVTVNDVVELSIGKTAATIFLANTNKTATINAILKKNDVEVTDASIVWTSSNPEVATVENGVVTGLTAGTAKITATYEGKNAECNVTVVKSVEYTTVDQEVNAMKSDSWYRFETDNNAAKYTDLENEGKIEIKSAARLDFFKVRFNPDADDSAFVSPVDNVNNYDKESATDGTKFYGYEYKFNVDLTANGNFNLILFATKALTADFSNGHRGIYLYFTDGKIELKQSGVGGDTVQATAYYDGTIADITSVSFGVVRLSNTEILLNLSLNGERIELVGSPASGEIREGGYYDNYSVSQSNGYGPRFCVVPATDTTVIISSTDVQRSTTK